MAHLVNLKYKGKRLNEGYIFAEVGQVNRKMNTDYSQIGER